MQILMTRTAHTLVRERLDRMLPDARLVIVTGPDAYEIDGRPVPLAQVNPDIAWLSLDSHESGLLATLLAGTTGSDRARWAQGFSAGLEAPVYQTMMRAGIRITRSEAQAVSIAEYVVGHALSLLVPIEAQAQAQAERTWRRTPFRQVEGGHWLLVGYGAIGKQIAQRARAFGVRLSVVRRSAGGAGDDIETFQLKDVHRALPTADVVVLACPLNDDTRDLADAAFFAAMKPGAIMINIGRGGLVDEDALRAGLDRDQPARAVLDVFKTEPLPADAWFWDHPKVRVSGHTSFNGDGNLRRSADAFLENLRRYLSGEPLLNEAQPWEVGLDDAAPVRGV